jgi:hypothetical protein
MQLSNQTEKTLKELLPLFDTCSVYKEKTQSGQENRKELNKISTLFFNDISKADKYIENIEIKGIIREYQPLLHYDNMTVPSDVRAYIEENSKNILSYTSIINGVKITINFIIFHDILLFMDDSKIKIEKYNVYAKNMFMWLYICSKYSKNMCVKELDVNVFLTPITRRLPLSNVKILGTEHINGAYTYCCKKEGEIYIFRKEDWFKVFIHETFHSFGLDFCSASSTHIKSIVANIFNIKSDFNIYEAYSETWAIIYNSAFISYMSMKHKNLNTFLMNFDVCLQTERLYKLFQCNKILDFMGLRYEDLYDDTKKNISLTLYRENTNVFSYCILACIFLNDYLSFLKWCVNKNSHMLRFTITDDNFNQFGKLIKTQYNSKTLLDGLKRSNNLLIDNKKQKNEFMLYRTNMNVFDM